MDTILVTGALGTVGRWTVAELAGDYEVVGIDRHRPTAGRDGAGHPDAEYLATDLTEQGPIREIFDDIQPAAVVHLAAVPGAGIRSGTETFHVNAASTWNVFEAAGRVDAEVVWTSSEATYGVTFREEARPLASLPVDESHPQRAEDGYGTSKIVGEALADRTVRRFDVPVTSLQPSWVQVPGAYETAPIREAFDPADPTPSGSLWSYVDVRDVATMVRRALETDRDGHEAYIAAAADNYLGVPTVDAIEAAWGDLPADCRLEGDESAFDTEKAARDLGWTPEHSWREAETAAVPGPTVATGGR